MPEIQAKLGKNSGKIWATIRAKCRGTKIKKQQEKKSGKFTPKERKIKIKNCTFKSIKNLPEFSLGLFQILLTASARIILEKSGIREEASAKFGIFVCEI